MSYPKVPAKAQRAPITKLSQQRKEKLLKLQEREELKGLLINKFKNKYSKQGPSSYIEKEVTDFMKNEVLTEENLARLDARLKDQTAVEHQKIKQGLKEGVPAVQPQKAASSLGGKAPSQGGAQQPPVVVPTPPKSKAGSQRSVMTGSSHHKEMDQMSIASTKLSEFSGLDNEEDEWAAILRYESIQYREEERARRMRENDLKTRIQRELDKQIVEKDQKKKDEITEDKLYEEAMIKNMEIFDNRENQKVTELKQKIRIEKELRDKQLREDKIRRKQEEKEQRDYDCELVNRLQQELQSEQKMLEQKKLEEKAYLKKVLHENEIFKKKQLYEREDQRLRDIQEAEEYARMVEKQEQDRIAEYKTREQRQQQLMARMADTVIKEQSKKISDEDMMILNQIKDRESFERAEEDRRKQRQADQKRDMKAFLEQQMQDKMTRKEMERQERMQQAEMWKRESEEFFKLEEEKSNKAKEMNQKHAEILKAQMDSKYKHKRTNMNNIEIAMNKKKLRQIKYRGEPDEPTKDQEAGAGLEVVGQTINS